MYKQVKCTSRTGSNEPSSRNNSANNTLSVTISEIAPADTIKYRRMA